MIETALTYEMWGHRKIAWLCRHQHGLEVADSTCLRILREAGLTLPVDYVAERRDLAAARREAFVDTPTRRNQVWQMDCFELETSGGGTWRSGDIIDYATKLVLAGPVTPTQTHRDAIASVQAAIDEAERILGRPLLDDLPVDPDTDEPIPIFLVSDNGPCFKAAAFARFIDARPELRHIRTRRKSPQTNGVIERYHGAIKIEQLWRQLPADGIEMTRMVDDFRRLYNTSAPTKRSPATARSSATSPTPPTALQTRSAHHSQRAKPCGLLDAGQCRRRSRIAAATVLSSKISPQLAMPRLVVRMIEPCS